MMRWLEQRQPGGDAVLLQDYPNKLVCIECGYCDRTERYGLASLVQRYGPAAGLPDVLKALSADCPQLQDCRLHGPCGMNFPDLVPRPSA